MSTSFQSKDGNFDKEMLLQPITTEEAMYSDLRDCSGIYHTSNLLLKLMHDIFIRLSATNS